MQKAKSHNQTSTKNVSPALSFEQIELATNFYDVANDYPNENFSQIAARVVGIHGFGRSKTAAAFKREAQKMFNLARTHSK